jgi:PTH1 family peptidyl-tRNA hydrolase
MSFFDFFQHKKKSEDVSDVLVVGLGNPGRKYEGTRHNIGFMVVNKIANETNVCWKKEKNYEIAKVNWQGKTLTLLKPQTYMNRSGEALNRYLNYHPEPEKIVIIQDDIDMKLGKVKVQENGGAGGHNGISSIKKHYKDNIIRIKVGVTSGAMETFRKENPSGFVLGKFTEVENEKVIFAVQSAIDAILVEI